MRVAERRRNATASRSSSLVAMLIRLTFAPDASFRSTSNEAMQKHWGTFQARQWAGLGALFFALALRRFRAALSAAQ